MKSFHLLLHELLLLHHLHRELLLLLRSLDPMIIAYIILLVFVKVSFLIGVNYELEISYVRILNCMSELLLQVKRVKVKFRE